MAQRLVRAMPLADAEAVLDVGAGAGALIPDLKAAAPRAWVVGVDGAIGMLRVARANVSVPLAAMDIQQLAIRDSVFDAALLAFVLFHLPDPVQGLSEIGRVLRPGGVLGVTTWGTGQGFPASAVWDEELAAAGAGPDPFDTEGRDDLMNTPEKLTALLGEAGFTLIEAWSERFEHRWTAESLTEQRTNCGAYRRRIDTLDEEARGSCLARVRERLDALGEEDLVYRPEINFAIARC
jgi:SAM-dependent methyltransferase